MAREGLSAMNRPGNLLVCFLLLYMHLLLKSYCILPIDQVILHLLYYIPSLSTKIT